MPVLPRARPKLHSAPLSMPSRAPSKAADSVSLVGFGTFSANERPAREGRNPRTGETIQIKAKTVAKFKPGKKLSESLN